MLPAPGRTLAIAVETSKSPSERQWSGACAALESSSIRSHEWSRFSLPPHDFKKAWTVVARWIGSKNIGITAWTQVAEGGICSTAMRFAGGRDQAIDRLGARKATSAPRLDRRPSCGFRHIARVG